MKHDCVPLADILTRSNEPILLDVANSYKEVTVRLWGKGVLFRGGFQGADRAGQKRCMVRAGQLILSRIDARNGAIGVVPRELDGAVVTNDFPVYKVDPTKALPEYIGWLTKTRDFVDHCSAASEGTTNRVRLKESGLLAIHIDLPPLAEQRRIVARIEELAGKIEDARCLKREIEAGLRACLFSEFANLTAHAPLKPMREIAPVVRRKVDLSMHGEYPELGIRSFGKGTFHKPAISGASVQKKLYRIEPGDLVFNNVFAWEGAVAVARLEDAGRVGSHRFITCVPRSNLATAKLLSFYLLTPEGLQKLGEASPGGAGRNRTLGLKALEEIAVPVPPIDKQVRFDGLQQRVENLRCLDSESAAELDALLPAILDKAFKGEL